MCQKDCSGIGLVVHATLDNSAEIDYKLLQGHKDNKIGLKHVTFKSSSQEGTINATRTNYHGKKELRIKALKEVDARDEIEYEGNEGSVKEDLKMQK